MVNNKTRLLWCNNDVVIILVLCVFNIKKDILHSFGAWLLFVVHDISFVYAKISVENVVLILIYTHDLNNH